MIGNPMHHLSDALISDVRRSAKYEDDFAFGNVPELDAEAEANLPSQFRQGEARRIFLLNLDG
jgi:hypothetical protein